MTTLHFPRLRLPARFVQLAIAVMAASFGTGQVAAGQTDYYNTDAGRPITVEDAYPVERRAFELQLAPLRVERSAGGAYTWGIEPEIAYGIFPRTHVELGFPLAFRDGPAGSRSSGLAGIEVGLFHNLNVETSIPALAVAAEGISPPGDSPRRRHMHRRRPSRQRPSHGCAFT